MILVIDRSDDICVAIKEALQEEGHKVDCATSMELARPLLEKNYYDLIFADYLTLKFHPDFSFVGQGRVVIMTSTSQDAERFTYSLPKPFGVTSLLDLVHSTP